MAFLNWMSDNKGFMLILTIMAGLLVGGILNFLLYWRSIGKRKDK